MIAFVEAGQRRHVERFTAEMDRTVNAVAWGVGIAFEPKNAAKWQRIRDRQGRGSGGLSGRALEQAVFAIAAMDPSLVKITAGEPAGAQ